MLDCIVVGAGLAGLEAAFDLVTRGRDVLVLEARERVGGRVENATLTDGQTVELGGQWIGPGHDCVLELVSRFGLQLVGANDGALAVLLQGGRINVPPVAPHSQPLTPFEVSDLGQGLLRLRRLADRVNADAAWTAANTTWLSQSIQRWIGSNLRTPGGQDYLVELFQDELGLEAADEELATVLARINSGIDLESLVAINGSVRQQRVAGGAAQLCTGLAAALGDRLELASPVAAIDQAADRVTVTLRNGRALAARSAVVTLPPWLLSDISFSPTLPQWRLDALAKGSRGNVIKAVLVYPTPWWRSAGFSGQAGTDGGALRVMFDTSVKGYARGILTGFFEGPEASGMGQWSVSLRERAFADTVTRVFGDAGHRPIEYVDRDWSAEEFTRGCHGAHFSPGAWSAAGPALAEPEGLIWFAGAEYAAHFNGYMEGAVRSGMAVASKVARALRHAA